MSLKQRIAKLERLHPSVEANIPLMLVTADESEEEARQRWQSEHPGVIPGRILLVRLVPPDIKT